MRGQDRRAVNPRRDAGVRFAYGVPSGCLKACRFGLRRRAHEFLDTSHIIAQREVEPERRSNARWMCEQANVAAREICSTFLRVRLAREEEIRRIRIVPPACWEVLSSRLLMGKRW